MSCNCKCGCDNRYSGGVQCYPLIVKIRHRRNVTYTCSGWNLEHEEGGPSVSLGETTNCSLVATDDNSDYHNFNRVYYFGLDSAEGGDCHGKTDSSAKIVFRVSPPEREWNGGASKPEDQKPPYTTWDGGNPDFSVSAEAKRKSSSDSDSVNFEATSNPDPSSDFSVPTDQYYNLVIEVDSGGSVSVSFENVR